MGSAQTPVGWRDAIEGPPVVADDRAKETLQNTVSNHRACTGGRQSSYLLTQPRWGGAEKIQGRNCHRAPVTGRSSAVHDDRSKQNYEGKKTRYRDDEVSKKAVPLMNTAQSAEEGQNTETLSDPKATVEADLTTRTEDAAAPRHSDRGRQIGPQGHDIGSVGERCI